MMGIRKETIKKKSIGSGEERVESRLSRRRERIRGEGKANEGEFTRG